MLGQKCDAPLTTAGLRSAMAVGRLIKSVSQNIHQCPFQSLVVSFWGTQQVLFFLVLKIADTNMRVATSDGKDVKFVLAQIQQKKRILKIKKTTNVSHHKFSQTKASYSYFKSYVHVVFLPCIKHTNFYWTIWGILQCKIYTDLFGAPSSPRGRTEELL